VSCAKTAELIEMPCGMLSRVDPKNRVLDGIMGVPMPQWGGTLLGECLAQCKA